MNKLFTDNKTDKVVLNENWYLITEGFRGIQLVNHYSATKKKKDGTEEKYIKEDSTYHANVGQALTRFTELSQTTPTKTVEEVLEVVKNIESILEEFKDKYKNW